MSGVVRVVTEDLQVSASKVDVHADDLRLRHGAADTRIEAARPGLPAGSATALNGAVAEWEQDTTVHYTKMVDHSTGLRAGAASYAEVDARGAEGLDSAIPPLDLGL